MSRSSAIGTNSRGLLPLSFLISCVLVATASAQRGGLNDPQHLDQTITSYQTAPGTGVLIFSVSAERTSTHLDRQALLKLVNLADHTATWQTTEDTSKGVFTDIPYGRYDVEVSAVGYLSTHTELQVMNSLRPSEIQIVLHRDPAAINLDATDAVMSPKARKQAKHAIALLKSNRLTPAQKELDAAYKLAPSSPDVNFLLGYLYFQKNEFAHAEDYLGTAANISPHNAQALTLLGRTRLEREEYSAARSALEQAVLVEADNWLPHDLLATAYLREKNYPQARDQAQTAIDKGKNTASPAELVLGQSLIALGQNAEGIRALNTFLDQSPRDPISPQVRALIAEIEEPSSGSGDADGPVPRIAGVNPLAALPAPGLPMKSWQPPDLDDVKPATAASVVCPLEKVIEESGKRVQEFVDDVSRFAAVEDLFHQVLDNYGIPVRTDSRKYNYVATISEPQRGVLDVDEYRANKLGLSGYPDQIASTGFATLALVFHPDMRDNFEIACEGLGDWRGQATWIIHFRQRDDQPNRMHAYKVGNQIHAVALKGRAWITADKFQIVRMEAQMMKAMPEIQLLSEHQIVEYGPVPFPQKKTTLWLPKSAEIYFDFRRHRYYRRHSFGHYMLYSVDADEKRKEPQAKKSS